LAGEYLARNQQESPRSAERKAVANAEKEKAANQVRTPSRVKVRFWPYS
jgi:hypothetical protein